MQKPSTLTSAKSWKYVLLLQFMGGPRYPAGPRPGVRMPQMGNDFNGVGSLLSKRIRAAA